MKVHYRVIKLVDVVTIENLLFCFNDCKSGKNEHAAVVVYKYKLLENLVKLRDKLLTGTYTIGDLHKFIVYEPKKRYITANDFEDKIVHKLICDFVLEPLISRRVIYDNYASQMYKGTKLAIERLETFMIDYAKSIGWDNRGWVVVFDIKKYFYTIDHEICKKQIAELEMDEGLRNLIYMQIDACTPEYNAYTQEEGKGVCIGFQTSQWLAVYYLNGLDHFIKEKLHIKYYGRYADDFFIIHEDKEYIVYCLNEIRKYLHDNLKLELNNKTHLHPFSQGICYLGYHITYNPKTRKIETVIRSKSINKAVRRARKQEQLVKEGLLTADKMNQSLEAWSAYAKPEKSRRADNVKLMISKRINELKRFEDECIRFYNNLKYRDGNGYIRLIYNNDEVRDQQGFIMLQPYRESAHEYKLRDGMDASKENPDLFIELNIRALTGMTFESRASKREKKRKKKEYFKKRAEETAKKKHEALNAQFASYLEFIGYKDEEVIDASYEVLDDGVDLPFDLGDDTIETRSKNKKNNEDNLSYIEENLIPNETKKKTSLKEVHMEKHVKRRNNKKKKKNKSKKQKKRDNQLARIDLRHDNYRKINELFDTIDELNEILEETREHNRETDIIDEHYDPLFRGDSDEKYEFPFTVGNIFKDEDDE